MKPLVFNATPLIYLTKVGLSNVFEGLKGEKLTSASVKREVVDEGKRRGVPDAIVLEKIFRRNVFKVVRVRDKRFLTSLLGTRGLHVTDAEVLAIAKERDGIAVIDDEVARKTATIYGISYVGTPYVLMRAVFHGLVTKDRAKRAINEMVRVGWRCSVESYAKIMDGIEKL